MFIAWFLYKPFGVLFKITPTFLVPFQDTILEEFFYTKINGYVWFIILFVGAFLLLKFLKVMFHAVSKVPGINLINKILGAVFGFINFIIISFIMIYFLSMPMFTNGVSLVEHSLLKPMVDISNTIAPRVVERLEDIEILNELSNDPKQASVEDVEHMQEYLEKNNIKIDNIEQFIKEVTQ